jgi:glycosyltransferase involved in cell wall biosynthesis
MMKRVLFVTYYFPPSGGPGVQRSLKFAKYLPSFGWAPTVLTVRPERASYPSLDLKMMEEIPPGLPVERTGAWDPYALYAQLLGQKKEEAVGVAFIGGEEESWKQKLGKWVRANLFLPDARVGWVPFAVRRGMELLDREPFDVILTSGPPQSVHLTGRALARRSGLPWCADFRDPWTDISYYQELPLTPGARRIDASLERSVLSEADRVIAVSPSLRRMLASKTQTPISVIMNGFDETDFRGTEVRQQEKFVIAHVGNLAASQNPDALWKALRQMREQGLIPDLRLLMVGNVDAAVRKEIAEYELEEILDFVPYVPHDEAVAYMRGASLLLLCINRVPDAECIMTGKLFEYLASGRPVLGIGPPEGDAAAVLDETGAGSMYRHGEAESVGAYVLRHYEAWKSGQPLPGANHEVAAPFSRRGQAEQLASLLSEVALSDRSRTQGSVGVERGSDIRYEDR